MWTDSQVKGKILHKLTRKGKFEHSHTALDNLQKGFPSEMKGRVKDTAQDLIKEEILHLKKTGYGKQVSINVEKIDKIMEYIDEFLNMD
ncbi:hypothetical protein CMO93_04515 [Candidatus Woesearchaeota archaeon]|nr:hypothetical protein [Candidatus Woesearchaeota archaeon]|tara:strand:- start:1032 stop:1298 length:267 start_codon:yes stop_codon:yes gene_type:complete